MSPHIATAVAEIPSKPKKTKPSVKNSPRKPGSIYSKRMSRNTSGKLLSNERDIIPTQQLIRKLQADSVPMQKIYGQVGSPRSLRKAPPRPVSNQGIQAYKKTHSEPFLELDDEADLPSIEDEYQNTVKAST